MNPPESTPQKLSITAWLVLTIASIGFLFDTYELLMTPLVAVPAIAELLQLPPNNPVVIQWFGNMLWMTALCGGIFGLLGGWFIDRFGRKTIMAASIFLYALSPFAAAFSTSLGMFFFFRCTTFIGVCVEFVAAITWLAELFPDKRQKEIALGSTQAFASLGGLLVTGMSVWIAAPSGRSMLIDRSRFALWPRTDGCPRRRHALRGRSRTMTPASRHQRTATYCSDGAPRRIGGAVLSPDTSRSHAAVFSSASGEPALVASTSR